MHAGRQQGATLIELTVSIVIVAIAAGAVLGVLSRSAGRSADAMVLAQGVAIAEAYLEEIMLKPFADPDGVDGETARTDFDDVDDYDGLDDDGAHNQLGVSLGRLSHYRVVVTVASSAALAGVPGADAARIDVRVTHPGTGTVALSGYKTRL